MPATPPCQAITVESTKLNLPGPFLQLWYAVPHSSKTSFVLGSLANQQVCVLTLTAIIVESKTATEALNV